MHSVLVKQRVFISGVSFWEAPLFMICRILSIFLDKNFRRKEVVNEYGGGLFGQP